jgi:hypothetical protein
VGWVVVVALFSGMMVMVRCGRMGRAVGWSGVDIWVLIASDIGISVTERLLVFMTWTRIIVVVTMSRVIVLRFDRERSVAELVAKLGLYIIVGNLMTA